MILAIITAILAYRKAKENGRNAVLWAIAGAGVFIGTQLLISMAIGVGLGLAQVMWDWPDTIYETYDLPVRILAIICSFLASWLLLRSIERKPVHDAGLPTPPPPPTFGAQS